MLDRRVSLGDRSAIVGAIPDPLGDHQILARKPADVDLIELGIGFIALDGYDRANRPHVIAPVREYVFVPDFLRL